MQLRVGGGTGVCHVEGGALPPPPPCGVLWSASQQSSTRQHNKNLISGTRGCFGQKITDTQTKIDTPPLPHTQQPPPPPPPRRSARATLSEQQSVLFPSNFGTLVLLSQRGGGGEAMIDRSGVARRGHGRGNPGHRRGLDSSGGTGAARTPCRAHLFEAAILRAAGPVQTPQSKVHNTLLTRPVPLRPGCLDSRPMRGGDVWCGVVSTTTETTAAQR